MVGLTCDGEDSCPAGLDDMTSRNAAEARQAGRNEGWTVRRVRVGGKCVYLDLCPDCRHKLPATLFHRAAEIAVTRTRGRRT